jgi:DNA-directed RNA polymerase specialized sigma24 family protein
MDHQPEAGAKDQPRSWTQEEICAVFQAWRARLRPLARRALGKLLRRHLGADDVLQDICLEAMAENARGRTWACADDLLDFLYLLMRRRVIDASRRHLHTERRRSDRPAAHAEDPADQGPLSRESDPAAEAAARDGYTHALKQQPAFSRVTLHLREAGWTNEMVSEGTGRAPRQIRKIVQKFVDGFLGDGSPPPPR